MDYSPERRGIAAHWEWRTRRGQTVTLGDMDDAHLKNLEGFLERQTPALKEAEEDLDNQRNGKWSEGFSAEEVTRRSLEYTLEHVRVELDTRCRRAAGETVEVTEPAASSADSSEVEIPF